MRLNRLMPFLLAFALLAGIVGAQQSGGGGTGGSGGAPTSATYITQTANATLTNEQPIGALATGILAGTTTTGVVSSVATGAGLTYQSLRGDGTFAHAFDRGTIVADDPFTWAQTWNNAAVNFTGVAINITSTASDINSASLLVKKGATEQLRVDANNGVTITEGLNLTGGQLNFPNTSYIQSASRAYFHTPTSMDFAIGSNGVGGAEYTIKAGTAPGLGAGCGTGATISGNNSIGRVTIGTTPGASCVLTFSQAWTTNAPHCDANNESVGTVVANVVPTTTTLTLTATLLSTNLVSYHCIGWQ